MRLGHQPTQPRPSAIHAAHPAFQCLALLAAKKGLGPGLSLDILCRVFELTPPRNAQKRHYKNGVRNFRHAFFCTALFFFFFLIPDGKHPKAEEN
jgi:hypothetical protein